MGLQWKLNRALRCAFPCQNARIGSGAQRKVNKNVGSGLVTVDVKQVKAGLLAQKAAILQVLRLCPWATVNAGRRASVTTSAAMQSMALTAMRNAGMVSTTMTDAASLRKSSEGCT